MPLDPRTLAVASNVVGGCVALLALLLWFSSKLYPGFGRWTIARLIVVLAMLLSIEIGIWPNSVSVILADGLGLLGVILSLEACREFIGLKPVIPWTYAAAGIFLAGLIYVNAVLGSLQLNYVDMGFAAAGVYAWIAWTLLQHRPECINRGQILTGLSFLVGSATYIARSCYFLAHPGGTVVDSSQWNIAFLLENMLYSIVVNFAFFVMHYERLLADKAEEAGRTAAANRALTELKESLEERVRKGTAELVKAQKMEIVGRLAGGIAHDFNNMLTVILGYTAMMRSDDTLAPQLKERVLEIEKAGLRSRDITNQLLGFSRQQIISPRTLDLNSALESSRSTLSRLIGEDVELRLHADPELWPIRFDASQLDQITMNLAVNARDAMPDGGVLTMHTRNLVLGAGSKWEDGSLEIAPGQYIQFSVDDNGKGMDKETLSHVFEPFFTTKPTGRGTGLGLATVYGIVRQNGGYISVTSKPGGGTRFSILFPRSHSPLASAGQHEESPPTPGMGTVLVVEDNRPVREMIAQFLTSLGYNPLLAESPEAALDMCADPAGRIDMMITDVVMPGMNGVVLSERARTLRPGLRVLFMSGYSSHVAVRRGLIAGGADFIQKPFTISALSKKIGEVISVPAAEPASRQS